MSAGPYCKEFCQNQEQQRGFFCFFCSSFFLTNIQILTYLNFVNFNMTIDQSQYYVLIFVHDRRQKLILYIFLSVLIFNWIGIY